MKQKLEHIHIEVCAMLDSIQYANCYYGAAEQVSSSSSRQYP